MKMIFVANEHLATSLQDALAGCFDRPGTDAVDFCYPDHTAGTRQLAKILSDALAENPAALPDIGCYENLDAARGLRLLVR